MFCIFFHILTGVPAAQHVWHSKLYFDIRIGHEYRILTFKEAEYRILTLKNHILTIDLAPNIVYLQSRSFFNIQNEAKFRISTFKILFWHSNWARILYFDIHNPILTFQLRPNTAFLHSLSYFDIRIKAKYRILTFKLGPNIAFWHSKSYFDNRNEAEYRILTFKFLVWH